MFEVVSESGADSADFFVGAGTHESLMRAGGGREACGSAFGLFRAAVVAELGTYGDVFAAVWASHGFTPK
jgi:hypothetical protein